MNKYTRLQRTVEAVFASSAWQDEELPVVPSNWTPKNPGTTYLRLSVASGGKGVNLLSTSGQVIIDIFTPAGSGPIPATTIADKLDTYLVGKSFQTETGLLQCFESSLVEHGQDAVNPALARSVYAVNFHFNGVT